MVDAFYVHLFPSIPKLYYGRLLGRIQRPPSSNETTKNPTEIHEKVVLSVVIPIARNIMPKMSKVLATLRLLKFIIPLLGNSYNF